MRTVINYLGSGAINNSNNFEDFEYCSTDEFVNINGFLIRAAGEIFIDDLSLSGAETVEVYNVAPNVCYNVHVSKGKVL